MPVKNNRHEVVTMAKLYINPNLLSPSEASEKEHVAELFNALGIKPGNEIGLLTKSAEPGYVRGIFHGFRRSNYGYWIAIGNTLQRCQNISSIGPSQSMKGGDLHTNWFQVDDDEA